MFGLELTTLLICIMIAFFGGVIRGFTGFAGSLFMLPCYALLLGPIAGMNIIILSGLVGVAFTVKRAIKYLVEGLMVAIAAFAIPKQKMSIDEVALIALTAAATFSILDTYIPSMAVSARSGAGFGIGANLVGFPRIGM